MAKKPKFYVVWEGLRPGVYTSWEACKAQVEGYPAAKYKSFGTSLEAERAYKAGYAGFSKQRNFEETRLEISAAQKEKVMRSEAILEALAVDAACSGNPGVMEYQGVMVGSGKKCFHFGPMRNGTNNIGEFLAIVHGLAMLKQADSRIPIYSDSRTAMAWVREKRCKTNLERNSKTEELFQIIERAENWLRTNTFSTKILKWDTETWGEIPADFGRK